jgi:hypothetical protein
MHSHTVVDTNTINSKVNKIIYVREEPYDQEFCIDNDIGVVRWA